MKLFVVILGRLQAVASTARMTLSLQQIEDRRAGMKPVPSLVPRETAAP